MLRIKSYLSIPTATLLFEDKMGHGVSKQVLQQRHVVIIGGGYAGCEIGVLLQKWGVPFTLIDPKAYFHLTMGALRSTVDPSK